MTETQKIINQLEQERKKAESRRERWRQDVENIGLSPLAADELIIRHEENESYTGQYLQFFCDCWGEFESLEEAAEEVGAWPADGEPLNIDDIRGVKEAYLLGSGQVLVYLA